MTNGCRDGMVELKIRYMRGDIGEVVNHVSQTLGILFNRRACHYYCMTNKHMHKF